MFSFLKNKLNIFMFLVGTIALSRVFGASRMFQAGDDFGGFLHLGLGLVFTIISFTFLAYSVYAEEKANNNLRVNFFFFDWIESKLEEAKV